MASRKRKKADKPLPKSDEIDWAPVSGVDQDLIPRCSSTRASRCWPILGR